MAASFRCSLFLTLPLLLPPQFPQLWCLSQAVIPSDMSPAPPGGLCSFLWCLPPFHNCVLMEVPQALLIGPGAPRAPPIGSALPCSWSGVEPAGAGWNQLIQSPPTGPSTTKTWQFMPNIPGKRSFSKCRLVAGLSLSRWAGLLSVGDVQSSLFSGHCWTVLWQVSKRLLTWITAAGDAFCLATMIHFVQPEH